MTDFKELILKNPDVEFVVHVQNKQELDALVAALEKLEFEYAIPLGTVGEMAESFVREDGYDGCWRVSRERGVAYNPSVEHWKFFTNDIVEIRDGEIAFHEGYASEKAARIEENKLRKAFFDDEYGKDALKLFGLEKRSVEEIEQWLAEKFGADREAAK
ncbi:MAG: hypothetical protein HDR72_03440 [Ruminococcaceae bacterium]|nr:hypothetical protein [Oscillospiraceae bacterium]